MPRDIFGLAQPFQRHLLLDAFAPFGIFCCHLREFSIDQSGRDPVDANSVFGPRYSERSGQAERAGLGGAVGWIAFRRPECRHRTDDDQRAAAPFEQVMEFQAAGHEAVEIDVDDALEAADLELAAAIENDTLRQDQHVEPIKGGLEPFDCFEMATSTWA